jgi:hydrogenase nickel incorporation protein HypA/HybF
MHEMGYVRDIISTVIDAAQKNGASEVRTVYLTVGEVRDIVDELMQSCFAFFARGTIAEHAEVVLTRVPFTVRCKQCGEVYPIDMYDETTLSCPSCGAKDYGINTGMEFYINRLDVA